MELGPQNHNGDGLLGPNSIMVVYVDPLGMVRFCCIDKFWVLQIRGPITDVFQASTLRLSGFFHGT